MLNKVGCDYNIPSLEKQERPSGSWLRIELGGEEGIPQKRVLIEGDLLAGGAEFSVANESCSVAYQPMIFSSLHLSVFLLEHR